MSNEPLVVEKAERASVVPAAERPPADRLPHVLTAHRAARELAEDEDAVGAFRTAEVPLRGRPAGVEVDEVARGLGCEPGREEPRLGS